MKEARVAVRMEVPLNENDLKDVSDPDFARQGMEYMRRQADELAASVGGRVVTDRLPSFTEPRLTSHAVLGGNWLLWASMWWVEVPDHVDIDSLVVR
jgi:hypothetical protein